jgi:hypothetical protein
VGAVLYFVLENTFPAHGGLSTFGKKSPESVRWIIRRSMADYNKRYETATEMLADLDYVAAASDPFAVKPAELPSMRGVEAVPASEPVDSPQVEVLAAAGSPVPPKAPPADSERGENVEVEIAGWGVKAGSEGIEVGKFGQEPVVRVKRPRPRIRVTNWWTGAYQVQDAAGKPGDDLKGMRAEARAMRDQVRGFRSQSDALRQQVHMGRMTARRAAREQIKQARARAKEMQRRARAHRHQAVRTSSRQPSGMMAFLGLIILLPFLALVLGLWRANDARRVAIHEQVLAMGMAAAPYDGPKVAGPLSLLLINDHPATANTVVQQKIEHLVHTTVRQGWDVVSSDEWEVKVRKYLPAGPIDPDDPNLLLRKTLLNLGVGGILRVETFPGEGEPSERINAVMIAVPETPEAPMVRIEVPPEAFD